MFTTGTKYFVGLAAVGLVTSVFYAVASDWGALGMVGLLSAFAALIFLVGINAFIREGDVAADDATAVATSGAAQPSPGRSAWPAVFSVGLAIGAVGLVTLPAIFILGVVVALAGGAEWMVQAWSERASADGRFNAVVRGRLAYPLELPLAAAFLLGIIVYGFSRLVLTLDKSAGVLLFGVAGAIVLFVGALLAGKKDISKSVVGGMCAIGLVALAAGGIATALSGEREQLVTAAAEDHFSVEHRKCDDKEHEWDEKASQSISAKSNIAATVRLTEDGLVARQVGLTGDLSTVTFARSNPSSIIFYNETDEPRRLNLELDTVELEGTDPPVSEQRIVCTAMVEKGGAQYVSVTVGVPSFAAESPYRMVVPGVDGTEIVIVVP
jgi:hypothetical protein